MCEFAFARLNFPHIQELNSANLFNKKSTLTWAVVCLLLRTTFEGDFDVNLNDWIHLAEVSYVRFIFLEPWLHHPGGGKARSQERTRNTVSSIHESEKKTPSSLDHSKVGGCRSLPMDMPIRIRRSKEYANTCTKNRTRKTQPKWHFIYLNLLPMSACFVARNLFIPTHHLHRHHLGRLQWRCRAR